MHPGPAARSDNELLEAIERGDQDALSEMLNRHAADVAASVHIDPKWRRHISIEDIMQETFREVWLDSRKFNRQSSFVTWMTTLAQNNLRDAIRLLAAQKRPHPTRSVSGNALEQFWNELTSGLDTPSQMLSKEQQREVLNQEIDHLPKDYQTVLRQSVFEDLSYAEIAKRMGRSEGWAAVVAHRARRALAKALAGHSIFSSFQ